MPTPQLAHKWQSVIGASVEDTLPSRKVMIDEILRVEFPDAQRRVISLTKSPGRVAE